MNVFQIVCAVAMVLIVLYLVVIRNETKLAIITAIAAPLLWLISAQLIS